MSAAFYEAVDQATREAPPVVLETRALVMRFGGITATNQVSLQLRQGARHALIGPNGAGKTTLINLLTGVLAPTEGSVWLDGQDITALAPHRRVQRGWCAPSRSTSCSPA
jgi:branched-chain amino acid transport system ATP-binding protein